MSSYSVREGIEFPYKEAGKIKLDIKRYLARPFYFCLNLSKNLRSAICLSFLRFCFA